MGNAFNACFMSCNTARNVIRTIVFRYKGHADDNNNVCKHDRGRTFFKWDMYFVVSAVGQVFAAIAFLDQRCSVMLAISMGNGAAGSKRRLLLAAFIDSTAWLASLLQNTPASQHINFISHKKTAITDENSFSLGLCAGVELTIVQ